jgi:hypothetical protein
VTSAGQFETKRRRFHVEIRQAFFEDFRSAASVTAWFVSFFFVIMFSDLL